MKRDEGQRLRLNVPIESKDDLAALEGALLAARAAELSQIRRRATGPWSTGNTAELRSGLGQRLQPRLAQLGADGLRRVRDLTVFGLLIAYLAWQLTRTGGY